MLALPLNIELFECSSER